LTDRNNIEAIADHFFRHEAGKMVAVLTKIFGTEHLQTAEDVMQETLLHALSVWKLQGIPQNPSAWLFRVAKNKAIDIVRRNKYSVNYDFSDTERILLTSEYTMGMTMEHLWTDEVINDELLQMMFACCHPGISEENQVTLILKTLCGFSTAEIARAFLLPEDSVAKRLYRAKEFFRKEKIRLSLPPVSEIKQRTLGVLDAIYLLFNEGYNSTSSEALIREDIMKDAIMLAKLLAQNEHTQIPEVYALLALMHFHFSRSAGRLNPSGGIILLHQQNRSKWDWDMIAQGNVYMNKAAGGNALSAYHIEAAISFEHCIAENFESTDWAKILEYYNWLCQMSPSPTIALNRAIIILKLHGPEKALQEVNNIRDKATLERYYLYHSLLGEIYVGLNNGELAKKSFEAAIGLTQSGAERTLLKEKIAALQK
jgi:RNA polymerase sigma factor (sigma-70 family)